MINRLIRRLAPRAGAMALTLPLLASPLACGESAPSQPIPAPLPACSGAIIIAKKGVPLGCDARPPQVIMIARIGEPACLDMGGDFIEDRFGKGHCFDIDY